MKHLTDNQWKGYSFQDLQEQILINEVRIHIQQRRLDRQVQPVRDIGKTGKNIVSTAMSLLDYVDYLRFGLTAYRKLRSIFSRKKKS